MERWSGKRHGADRGQAVPGGEMAVADGGRDRVGQALGSGAVQALLAAGWRKVADVPGAAIVSPDAPAPAARTGAP